MKFPLKERPFDSVKLSQQRYDELERIAEQVVDVTLQEFRDFVDLQNRVMDKRQWKPVKKRDNVVVYKQLTARHERVFGALGARIKADDPLVLPKLVAVGSVRGLMDDMLMGTAVRDPASVLIKSSYVGDLIVDCSVVHQMRGASMDNPFRFVALKWIVKSHPSGLSSVVTPRDLTVVQSSGWIPEEGIGYHLLHSVDIPELPPLDDRYPILRSRISTMFIFRQLTPDLVEIYVANYIEPNGSAPESVGIISSAVSMCSAWKSLGCAHNMKLAWVLKNREAYLGQSTHHDTVNTSDKCELCHRKATLTDKLGDCVLCETRVCSRCRMTKKLSRVNRRLELTTVKHEVCKTCFVRVVNEDASRIASEMNAGAPITPWGRSTQTPARKYSIANSQSSGSSRGRQSHDTETTTSSRDLRSLAYATDNDVESVILEPMNRDDEDQDDEWSVYSSHPQPKPVPASTQGPVQPQDFNTLYAQMKSLQIAAERTYNMTTDTSRQFSLRNVSS